MQFRFALEGVELEPNMDTIEEESEEERYPESPNQHDNTFHHTQYRVGGME